MALFPLKFWKRRPSRPGAKRPGTSPGAPARRRASGAEVDREQLRRMRLVGGALMFGFMSVLAMTGYLQGCERDVLLEQAERNYLRTLRLDTQRGEIFDRNFEALATSVEVDTVYANPRTIDPGTKEQVAQMISEVLSLPVEAVMRALEAKAHFRYIKRQITAEEAQAVQLLIKQHKIAGIYLQKEAKRFYPKKELAGQFLGVVGFDSMGVDGLESAYDSVLKGTMVSAPYQRDTKGRYRMLDALPPVEGAAGKSLKLTIDEKIQAVAEAELERAVVSFLARSGMAVVMDVQTGDILAAAHYPRFNPNRYLEIVGADRRAYERQNRIVTALRRDIREDVEVDPDLFEAVRMQTMVPRQTNRIAAYVFEPGSIFKVITLAAALEEGVVGLSDMIDTEKGRLKVGKKFVYDTHRFEQKLSVTELVKYSSNVGFIKLGGMLGRDRFYDYVQNFGFGTPTGIDIGGDFKGQVPAREKWGSVVLSNIAFGQGIAVTALQMTAALAAIGNGGVLMKPRIVQALLDSDRKVIEEYPPQAVRRVVSPGTARAVVKSLESVVEWEGTGHQAWMYDYDVAGKTGTAQKVDPIVGGYSTEHWTASFIGLAPAKAPRLAVAVIIDEPKGLYYGGLVAAPAFKAITEWTLHYLGEAPSYGPRERIAREEIRRRRGDVDPAAEGVFYEAPLAGKSPAAKVDEPKEVVVPDFTDLAVFDAVRRAHANHLVVDIDGAGTGSAQSVPAGTRVPSWTRVTVYFRPGDTATPSREAWEPPSGPTDPTIDEPAGEPEPGAEVPPPIPPLEEELPAPEAPPGEPYPEEFEP